MRDAALNDPRASLQADWLSACAGHFLDSTLLSSVRHPCTQAVEIQAHRLEAAAQHQDLECDIAFIQQFNNSLNSDAE